MTIKVVSAAFCCVLGVSHVSAQTPRDDNEMPRPRVIVTNEAAAPAPTPTPKKIIILKKDSEQAEDKTRAAEEEAPVSREYNPSRLRFGDFQSLIEEAKRKMRVSPLRTSLNETSQTTDIVRLAFLDRNKGKVDYVVVPKTEFLSRKTQGIFQSEEGETVRVETIRGNGVNTPVVIYDSYNRPHQPFLVQYPVERGGKFVEMAYYVSTHPGIVTPDTVAAGRLYVRSVLNAAREELRGQGHFIQPKVADIAERLALVEHVDHWRFRNEPHSDIYNDVYALYALNEGQTYRYAVSSAGAGGMVQMIPSTYRMIRSRFYSVGLMPDFVEGMRDHQNAAKAMLLYMQMTWDDLVSNRTVTEAMKEGIATQEQLMSAGYNSNPARLPGYIKRGGENWTQLIPRETKMYLQIYDSVEKNVNFRNRSK